MSVFARALWAGALVCAMAGSLLGRAPSVCVLFAAEEMRRCCADDAVSDSSSCCDTGALADASPTEARAPEMKASVAVVVSPIVLTQPTASSLARPTAPSTFVRGPPPLERSAVLRL